MKIFHPLLLTCTKIEDGGQKIFLLVGLGLQVIKLSTTVSDALVLELLHLPEFLPIYFRLFTHLFCVSFFPEEAESMNQTKQNKTLVRILV